MCEKRGYPNPDYTDDDVMTEEAFLEEVGLVTVDTDHYEELVTKAAMFDCLTSTIKLTGKVDDDVVKALTGNLTQETLVPKKEADDYWRYYTQESAMRKKLEEKVAELERSRKELIEILKQNGIGEPDEKTEQTEEKKDGEV